MADQQTKGILIHSNKGIHDLVGVIDEFADLTPLLAEPAPLRLKLARIRRFNSIGIRNLLGFLKSWNKGAYEFIDCPVDFIDQVELIPTLLKAGGTGRITSCFGPFVCSSCGAEEEILVSESELTRAKSAGKKPTKACPRCRQTMNVESENYFAFLNI